MNEKNKCSLAKMYNEKGYKNFNNYCEKHRKILNFLKHLDK